VTAPVRSVIQNAVPDSPDRVGVIAATSMPARSRSTPRAAPAHASALVTLRLLPAGSGGKRISIRELFAAVDDSAGNVP